MEPVLTVKEATGLVDVIDFLEDGASFLCFLARSDEASDACAWRLTNSSIEAPLTVFWPLEQIIGIQL